MRDKQTPSPTRRSVLASLGALSAATALEGCTGGYLISATSSSPATAPAVPWDVVHVPITGQSLANGDQTQPVVSGSQPFANVMFNTNLMPNPSVNAITLGATTVAWVPLTATLTGNPTAQNAETLGNGFADTVIAMSALTAPLYPGIRTAKQILMSGSGVSGAVYLQICGPTDAPPNGTASFQELLAQVRAAKAFATAANKTYFVPCVVVIHGEFDNYNPAYLTDLLHWQADIQTGIQAITGQTATIPLILAQTCVGDLGSNSSPYAQWQAAVQYPDRFILAGPEYQLPHNAGDPTHLTIHLRAIGERMLGAMVARAYRRVFFRRRHLDAALAQGRHPQRQQGRDRLLRPHATARSRHIVVYGPRQPGLLLLRRDLSRHCLRHHHRPRPGDAHPHPGRRSHARLAHRRLRRSR
jgi:hypothetical protein